MSQQASSRLPDRGRAAPYKLVVIGTDIADTVCAIGGLMFDCARSGWHVDVHLETGGEHAALQILGVSGRILPARFEFEPDWPDAIFFAAGLQECDRGVRKLIDEVSRRRRAFTAAWDASGDDIEHRLSTAAQAFKREAMRAAGMDARACSGETFHSTVRPSTDVPPPLPRA